MAKKGKEPDTDKKEGFPDSDNLREMPYTYDEGEEEFLRSQGALKGDSGSAGSAVSPVIAEAVVRESGGPDSFEGIIPDFSDPAVLAASREGFEDSASAESSSAGGASKPSEGGFNAEKAAAKRVKARPKAVNREKGEVPEGIPYIKITTGKGRRGRIGPDSAAPLVAWKVEVIDPKKKEPLKVWKNPEASFLTLRGHPMSNYMHLMHEVIPELETKGYVAKDGKLAPRIVTEYDSTSAGEERANVMEDKALQEFGGVMQELAGTGIDKLLTQMDYAASGSEQPTRLAPWQALRQILLQGGFNFGDMVGLKEDVDVEVPEEHKEEYNNLLRKKAVGYLVNTFKNLGLKLRGDQARKLIESSSVLAGVAPGLYSKIAKRRAAEDYWGGLFNDAINLTGNFNPLFNHMLLDSKDSDLPGMIAFMNGERSDQIDWDKFYNTVGPVGRFIKVHPTQDLPFLWKDSPEVKKLLEGRTKDGKVDLAGLDSDLLNLNNELFDYAKYIAAPGEKKREGGDNYITLTDSSGKETHIPTWDMYKKYEQAMVPSLGENWAKFIRGTGGYGFKGSVSSQRLNPESDIADDQYNPVLKNVYARAIEEAPWLANILRSYYLNYGEEPFTPDLVQLKGLINQIGSQAATSLDFLSGKHEPGEFDNLTALSPANFDSIADYVFRSIFHPDPYAKVGGVPYVDVLNNITDGGYYIAPYDNSGKGKGKGKRDATWITDAFKNLLFGSKRIQDPKTGEERSLLIDSEATVDPETGKVSYFYTDPETGEIKNVSSQFLAKSKPFRQAVARAIMRRALSDPEAVKRMYDPTGWKFTFSPLDVKALKSRQQKAREAEELSIENLIPYGIGPGAYDKLIDNAENESRLLGIFTLADLLGKTGTLGYKPGVGLVDDLSAFLKPYKKLTKDTEPHIKDSEGVTDSDKRIKRPVRKGKKGAVNVGRLAGAVCSYPASVVSDAGAKEPSDWERWEARRKALVGGDY